MAKTVSNLDAIREYGLLIHAIDKQRENMLKMSQQLIDNPSIKPEDFDDAN